MRDQNNIFTNIYLIDSQFRTHVNNVVYAGTMSGGWRRDKFPFSFNLK